MSCYAATDDFAETLEEVDYLLKTAAANEQTAAAYNALNKAAILLLTAKLEAFCEQILEEFCFNINKKCLPSERLPTRIRLDASRKILCDVAFLDALACHKETKTVPVLEALSRLWHQSAIPVDIKVDCKFNYGKHGETELRRLFQRIGIDDVFDKCKVEDESELYDAIDEKQITAMTSDVNALTGLRNFIIHNDGTPTVTHTQLERYRKRLVRFAQAIDSSVCELSDRIT